MYSGNKYEKLTSKSPKKSGDKVNLDVLSHLSIIGTLIRKIFRKNNSSALCCVQKIGEPYALDHNDAECIWFLEF